MTAHRPEYDDAIEALRRLTVEELRELEMYDLRPIKASAPWSNGTSEEHRHDVGPSSAKETRA